MKWKFIKKVNFNNFLQFFMGHPIELFSLSLLDIVKPETPEGKLARKTAAANGRIRSPAIVTSKGAQATQTGDFFHIFAFLLTLNSEF